MNTFFLLRRIIIRWLYQLGKISNIDASITSILCYHSISNDHNRFAVGLETFEGQMEKISEHGTFVSLDEIIASREGAYLPSPSVAITIDDGYHDAISILPITKRLGIPIALFVLSDPERAEKKALGSKSRLLSWEEIKYLRKEGWTIGCHSATHPNFFEATETALRQEIVNAKQKLEEMLGEEVEYFAYPGGRFEDRSIRFVQEAGFKAGFSIREGCAIHGANQWIIPRTIIDKTHMISEFPAVYSPTTFFLRKWTDPLRLWNIFLKFK
ncbi:polysaccharide deacetylase family protein [Patescibacteria group bacterium]|nr:MAG: polysaccharide deacetylase family protein [Patescibacteria group bacterium]